MKFLVIKNSTWGRYFYDCGGVRPSQPIIEAVEESVFLCYARIKKLCWVVEVASLDELAAIGEQTGESLELDFSSWISLLPLLMINDVPDD